jgi:DNA adenine methylase
MDVRPIVKWAGGKSALVPALRRHVPSKMRIYVEPFAGGAALFFALSSLRPRPFARAILVDQNADLVACYTAVKNDVEEVIERLQAFKYDRDQFYEVRAMDTAKMSDGERGARLIYLNKTCFNGLWRVNSKGQFNVPFGRLVNPKICDEKKLRAAARALAVADIVNGDFASPLAELGKRDFVYFDPPYVPVSKTANFTAYARGGFDDNDQARLVLEMQKLAARGVSAVLSNANTPETQALYRGFERHVVEARRSINSDIKRRGPASELVVLNRPRARSASSRANGAGMAARR